MRELLLVSAGPVPLLAAELSAVPGVDVAFLYGSFAARMLGEAGTPPRDIDVMVVGTPDPMTVYEACGRVSEQVGRPVNPTIMTPAELEEHSGFLASVRRRPAVAVIGDLPWP